MGFFSGLTMFPAQAGMNRQNIQQDTGRIDVPRAGGDEPRVREAQRCADKCSPRRRG